MKLSYGYNDVNIKIDINRHIWKHNTYEIHNFYGTDILCQDRQTIFANKLVALTQRNTNRDIYDTYFFLKNGFGIHDDLILERTGVSRKTLFAQVVKKLEKLSENYKILD